MNRHLLCGILLLASSVPRLTQGQNYNQKPEFLKANNVWTFADSSGLNFNSGTPGTPISTINSGRGDAAAAASDPATGQLLFYSDGERCYNAQHEVMLNGDGILSGFGSQSVVIVPFINDPSKYYLFGIGGYQDVPLGEEALHYSVVDMTLDGGKGGIVPGQKNILVSPPTPPGSTVHDSFSTAMIAIPGNNCDVWLLTHGFGKSVFYAYHITADGLDTVPVASTAGHLNATGVPVLFFGVYYSGSYYRSALAASPDRQFISISSMDPIAKALAAAPGDMNGHLICRFDPETGIVSDPIEIGDDYLTYGSAFSPDGSKLYMYNLSDLMTGIGYLYQYDITNYDSTAIANSKVVLDSTQSTLYYNMQLFRDTIFLRCDQWNGISRIDNPNQSGHASGLHLTTDRVSTSRVGLQTEVVYSLPDTVRELVVDTFICQLEELALSPFAIGGDYEYTWSNGATDSVVSVEDYGIYWVSYDNGCHFRVDTFRITGSALHPVISINEFQLTTALPYSSYQWMLNGSIIDGATDRTHDVRQNGDYQVIVTDSFGCTDTSDVYVVDNYTSINAPSIAGQITVYPNPAVNRISVKSPVPLNLRLCTPDGRQVKSVTEGQSMDIEALPSGIYFLRLEDKEGRTLKVEKIIKAHQP